MNLQMALGEYAPRVQEELEQLARQNIVSRIWQADHTVWKPEPAEISNRLGWLKVVETMRNRIPEMESFEREIRQAGIQYIVLLGMGGSSLGPEVLRSVFGKREGYPELIVLDSIDPDWILQVQDRIDLNHTLFLISSKSGSTIEPNLLYEYFRSQVESVTGKDRAGDHFVAITDEGSPLAKRAQQEGFRRILENPSDIGGRYSVLSYFGLVPGVLAGVDIGDLLNQAEQMKKACMHNVPQDNPGLLLGAIMGVMALDGRDKLTLVTSPGIGRFGLWIEQLIAESTGKDGTGIIPIAAEPLVDPKYYGNDRFFVFLRMQGDDNELVDSSVRSIRESGQPEVTIEMYDKYALGVEFFRWEFAVAVASSILHVNPFDQPDVQRSKDATNEILKIMESSETIPPVKTNLSLEAILRQAREGDYVAIMAYIVESEETNNVILSVRKEIMERYKIATTFGYGPRLLHSTGQLHKGGPLNALFIQLTTDHDIRVAVPGKTYTFGQLTNAQAMGDMQIIMQSGRPLFVCHLDGPDSAAAEKLSEMISSM